MSTDDEGIRLLLQDVLRTADLPLRDPTPEQYAARRRNHARLVEAGVVKESEQDPEWLRSWLGPDPQEPPC